MLSRLHELIKAKNILILGFGREGRSTLNRILEVGDAASITIADGNEALTLPAAMEITTLSGEKKSVLRRNQASCRCTLYGLFREL